MSVCFIIQHWKTSVYGDPDLCIGTSKLVPNTKKQQRSWISEDSTCWNQALFFSSTFRSLNFDNKLILMIIWWPPQSWNKRWQLKDIFSVQRSQSRLHIHIMVWWAICIISFPQHSLDVIIYFFFTFYNNHWPLSSYFVWCLNAYFTPFIGGRYFERWDIFIRCWIIHLQLIILIYISYHLIPSFLIVTV